jgi:hypothetical protein
MRPEINLFQKAMLASSGFTLRVWSESLTGASKEDYLKKWKKEISEVFIAMYDALGNKEGWPR